MACHVRAFGMFRGGHGKPCPYKRKVNQTQQGANFPLHKSKKEICISLTEIHKSVEETHISLEEIHKSAKEIHISPTDLHNAKPDLSVVV